MARKYAHEGFVFDFLYGREAHPGENFPAHRSMEQKLALARAFKERFQIERAVRYIQDSRARRREGFHMAPFYAEIVGYRWSDPGKVTEGLVRAGPRAVANYERAMAHRQKQGPRPGRIEIDD